MPSEYVFLQWNDHGRLLSGMFKSFRAEDSLVDCTLAAEGQYLDAHRLVLSACSPYFELLCKAVKGKHPVFILKDVKFEDLKAVLDFMYCGEVGIPRQQLKAFLKTAESLQVKELMSANDITEKNSSVSPQETVKRNIDPSMKKKKRVVNRGEAPEYEFVAVDSIMNRHTPEESSAAVHHNASCSSVGSPSAGASGPVFPAASGFGTAMPAASGAQDELLSAGLQPPQVDSACFPSEVVVALLKAEPLGSVNSEFEAQKAKNIDAVRKEDFAKNGLMSCAEAPQPFSQVFVPFVKTEPASSVNSFGFDLRNANKSTSELCEEPEFAMDSAPAELIAYDNLESSDDGIEDVVSSPPARHGIRSASEPASIVQASELLGAETRFHEGSNGCDEITIEDDMKCLLVTGVEPISGGPASPNGRSHAISGSERPAGAGPLRAQGRGRGAAAALLRRRRAWPALEKYACAVCSKAFSTPTMLTRHERVHTGEKPYMCGACGACFAQNGDLTRHARTHSGEKPYKCRTCEARFAQLGVLRRHERSHSGEKPFRCEICGKQFADRSNWNAHRRVVHGDATPYVCNYCGGRFKWRKGLARHVRAEHGAPEPS